jgi:predicted methyltransferase
LARFATQIAQEDDLKSTAGIVLDIQQLFARTRSHFLDELHVIPVESVKGFHC